MVAVIDSRPTTHCPGDWQTWIQRNSTSVKLESALHVVSQIAPDMTGNGQRPGIKRINRHSTRSGNAGQRRYLPWIVHPTLTDSHDAPIGHPGVRSSVT